MAVMEQLIGKVLDEKYRLEEQLGQGGMGAVYLATHIGTERAVALKVIAPQFMAHPEFVERFKREAKAAGRLRHPNVVNVTDFGFAHVGENRVAYLVMEYLDGCNLGEVLSEEGRLPLGFVVDILEQVCAAVDEAHRQGIIHRDLKPDNIWLEPNGRGGYTVKVLDFGLAKLGEAPPPRLNGEAALMLPNEPCMFENFFSKVDPVKLNHQTGNLNQQVATPALASFNPGNISAITAVQQSTDFQEAMTLSPATLSPATSANNDEEATRAQIQHVTARNLDTPINRAGITHVGTVLGTPLYMSPEQCRGEQIDTRSDIYSIGVIAYQMLAGQTPFTGDTNTLIAKHSQIVPPPLKEHRHDLPGSIAVLIMSALAKNPADRPATAAALGNALRARSEGAGSLLRQAIAFYSQHFPTFIRISLIAHIPFIIFTELLVVKQLWLDSYLPKTIATASLVVLYALAFVTEMFAKTVNASVFTPAVAQLTAAPLRQVELRSLFATMKGRLWALAFTCLLYQVLTQVGTMLFIIPGIVMTISYSLHTPVVMMDGLSGWPALKRSKVLVHQMKKTVIWIVFINFIGCTITSLLGGLFSYNLMQILNLPIKSTIFVITTKSIAAGSGILINPLIAIALAMLYFKTRQASGETVKETLGNFAEESYRSKWQQRISERIHMRSRLLKSSIANQLLTP